MTSVEDGHELTKFVLIFITKLGKVICVTKIGNVIWMITLAMQSWNCPVDGLEIEANNLTTPKAYIPGDGF